MKILQQIVCSLLVLLALSCNNRSSGKKEAKDQDSGTINMDQRVDSLDREKNVTTRDYSITRENAFNDIFVDSMALERYIAKKELGDKKIGIRMRSFYNARN